jgi:hypothetical protein
MTTSSDPASHLVARLSRLERQHRQLRRVAIGGLCLVPFGLAAFATGRSAPVVQADRVELVTADGARRAVLSTDSAGVSLMLFDRKGRPASSLRLSNQLELRDNFPTLTLRDSRGAVVATLGGPMVKHLVE